MAVVYFSFCGWSHCGPRRVGSPCTHSPGQAMTLSTWEIKQSGDERFGNNGTLEAFGRDSVHAFVVHIYICLEG